ncbi:hypothetical protein MRX96_031364 [Rhipicephalus microplus]
MSASHFLLYSGLHIFWLRDRGTCVAGAWSKKRGGLAQPQQRGVASLPGGGDRHRELGTLSSRCERRRNGGRRDNPPLICRIYAELLHSRVQVRALTDLVWGDFMWSCTG